MMHTEFKLVDAAERKTDKLLLIERERERERRREGRTSRDTAAAATGRRLLQMLRLKMPAGVTS